MAIHYKKEVIPEHITTCEDYRTCDICKKKIEDNDLYDFCDIDVEMERGSRYPDGGSSTTYSVDVCEDCFVNKIMPAIESMGAEFRVKESDW